MIKNIVFDLGGVLLDFRPRHFLQQRYDEIRAEDLERIIFSSRLWEQLDRGTIEENEVVSLLCARYPEYQNEIKYVFSCWTEMLQPLPTVDFLEEINESYYLYYLTNFHRKAWGEVKNFPFFDYFKGGIVSAEVNHLKPEPEIYDVLLKSYNLKAKESIFIDDRPENIETARKKGFQVHQFISPEYIKREFLYPKN